MNPFERFTKLVLENGKNFPRPHGVSFNTSANLISENSSHNNQEKIENADKLSDVLEFLASGGMSLLRNHEVSIPLEPPIETPDLPKFSLTPALPGCDFRPLKY